MPSHPSLLVAAALLSVACIARAGPREDVKAAMQKFINAKSYHVTLRTSGPQAMTTEADFAAPDRYRLQTPAGTQVIIGDTMHMSMQGGSMQVPKGTLSQWRDPGNLRRHEATMTVEALGADVVAGKPAKKYRVSNTQPQPSTSTLWIGADGYPLQVRATSNAQGKPVTVTIRYSRFNDPTLKISAP
jgi:outer membrane lipoprotein-sorting protein